MRMAPLVTPFAASASFGKLAGRAVVLLPVNGTALSQLTGLDAVRARRFSRLYDIPGENLGFTAWEPPSLPRGRRDC